MDNKTHRVQPGDRERIRCATCDSPADVCEHVGGGFYYFCDPCHGKQIEKREQREAHSKASAKANAETRVHNALQIVKEAILAADADGLPAWESFRTMRDELRNAGILLH